MRLQHAKNRRTQPKVKKRMECCGKGQNPECSRGPDRDSVVALFGNFDVGNKFVIFRLT
jgi:hypothetical protein